MCTWESTPVMRSRAGRILGHLALLAAAAGLATAVQAETLIRFQPPESEDDQRDDYVIQVLELALEQTRDDFGPASLHQIGLRMTQDRAVREMRNGRYIDVLWMMTSAEREDELIPVRIPLAGGLLGVRVPVVRGGDTQFFATVREVSDLRPYVAGQGHDWPDTRVLRHNGLEVMTATGYHSLFRMLERGRFDYLPRSIMELTAEQPLYERFGLQPHKDLLLVYHAPNYFFVSRDHEALALRLETGLERAIDDGSLQELMREHPATRDALAFLETEQPRLVPLDNPVLPEHTPTERRELWVDALFDAMRQHQHEYAIPRDAR